MTPHPRDSADTQEHCEHECVCNKYIDYTNTGATAGRVCNGETWCFKPCPNDTRKEEPTREDLITFARWTQKFWREGQEIQRKHGIVIDDLDDPMQKLVFTYYMNLCEIDREVLHLFGEGYGDENYSKEHEIYTPEHDAQVAAKERERVKPMIQELRNALIVAANNAHERKAVINGLNPSRMFYNEGQFESLVEYALDKSKEFKADHESESALDWKRQREQPR